VHRGRGVGAFSPSRGNPPAGAATISDSHQLTDLVLQLFSFFFRPEIPRLGASLEAGARRVEARLLGKGISKVHSQSSGRRREIDAPQGSSCDADRPIADA
jgi:hypothetical protein